MFNVPVPSRPKVWVVVLKLVTTLNISNVYVEAPLTKLQRGVTGLNVGLKLKFVKVVGVNGVTVEYEPDVTKVVNAGPKLMPVVPADHVGTNTALGVGNTEERDPTGDGDRLRAGRSGQNRRCENSKNR